MALFKRADLKAQGLTDEQIEFVMTEGNRSLAGNYTLTSDVQSQISAAVQAAQTAPQDVKSSKEYLDLLAERDMLRAIGGDDFADVKPKFRETVYNLLDHGENAPDAAEQKNAIREKYEEYFLTEQQKTEEAPKAPSFGAPTQGSAPTGKTGPSFMDTWGFVPKGK